MNYTKQETVFSYKNWDLVQKEDIEALEDLRQEMIKEWLEWEELEEELIDWAWGQEIIILTWEENWDYREWKVEIEEAEEEYQKMLESIEEQWEKIENNETNIISKLKN